MADARADLTDRIEAIEESYEFFLAFAAQGLSGTQATESTGQVRTFLDKAARALDGLPDDARAVVDAQAPTPPDAYDELLAGLARDAAFARAAVRAVAGRDAVSSQLVDNLNANIHLRALLTDLFLLDELLDG